LIMGIVCSILNIAIHGQRRLKGEQYGFKYPLHAGEIGTGKFGDAAWFTKALRSSNVLPLSVSVTEVVAEDFNSTGLLSGIVLVKLKYSAVVQGVPDTLIVKFAPPSLETRITTDLFHLGRTEYLAYRKLSDSMPFAHIPICYFGDFNHTSKNYILCLEKVKGSFRDQVKHPLTLGDAMICVKSLARFHAKYMGNRASDEVDFVPPQSSPIYGIFGKVVKHHWNAGVKRNAPNKMAHNGWTYQVPGSFLDVVDDIIKTYTQILWYQSEGCPDLTGVTHGDPRLDNWFFFQDEDGKSNAGILDFQIMTRTVQASDLAWLICTSCTPEFAAAHEASILEEYLQTLESEIKEPVDREMWMEEYSLSYIGAIGKCIIGAGGIKAIDEQVINVMNMLLSGSFAGWERNNTSSIYTKFRSGNLKAQQKFRVKIPGMIYTKKAGTDAQGITTTTTTPQPGDASV